MSIVLDVLSVLQNHRGFYFEGVGDGAATTIKVPHGRIIRPGMTVTASAVTAPTSHNSPHTGGGGLPVKSGTTQAITSATVASDGTCTVTFTAAPTNATRVYVNCVH